MLSRLTYILLLCLVSMPLWAVDKTWLTLEKDGYHDPSSPALEELQDPGEFFKGKPMDFLGVGNQIDWVRALNSGAITPRSQLYDTTEINELDLDIIMDETGEMPLVRFPHKAHTDWLDCDNCHEKIFISKAGTNPVNMFAILAGEYCGRCHGAVSFPLTECRRCHSVSRESFTGKPGAQPGPGKVYPPVKEQKVVK